MFYTPRGKLIEVEKGFDVPSYVLSHTMRGQVSRGASDGRGRTLPRRLATAALCGGQEGPYAVPALSVALSLR